MSVWSRNPKFAQHHSVPVSDPPSPGTPSFTVGGIFLHPGWPEPPVPPASPSLLGSRLGIAAPGEGVGATSPNPVGRTLIDGVPLLSSPVSRAPSPVYRAPSPVSRAPSPVSQISLPCLQNLPPYSQKSSLPFPESSLFFPEPSFPSRSPHSHPFPFPSRFLSWGCLLFLDRLPSD